MVEVIKTQLLDGDVYGRKVFKALTHSVTLSVFPKNNIVPYGDESVLIRKLRENVLTLPDETVIYPGHGHSTTIKEERAENPFFTTIY